MATTTNFGWETPDDTDLVKDGALAIRTLGSAIDTSLVDLKGGTSGQVLSKTSNTDLDFTWVTTDDANAIQNAIVDAKGDLITATAADTPARLAVGTNGQVLSADSTTATGLKWIPAGADSYTQLASVSLTGASVSISSISGSYKKLVLVIQDWYLATDAENLTLRFNNDSTAGIYGQTGVANGTAYSNAQSFIWASYGTPKNANNSNAFVLEMEDYTNTNSWKIATAYNAYRDQSTDVSEFHTFRYESTSAITEINIRTTAGNLSGGTAILYGVK